MDFTNLCYILAFSVKQVSYKIYFDKMVKTLFFSYHLFANKQGNMCQLERFLAAYVNLDSICHYNPYQCLISLFSVFSLDEKKAAVVTSLLPLRLVFFVAVVCFSLLHFKVRILNPFNTF